MNHSAVKTIAVSTISDKNISVLNFDMLCMESADAFKNMAQSSIK